MAFGSGPDDEEEQDNPVATLVSGNTKDPEDDEQAAGVTQLPAYTSSGDDDKETQQPASSDDAVYGNLASESEPEPTTAPVTVAPQPSEDDTAKALTAQTVPTSDGAQPQQQPASNAGAAPQPFPPYTPPIKPAEVEQDRQLLQAKQSTASTLGQPLNRADYKPSIWRHIQAAIVGAGEGFARDPNTSADVQRVLNRPYDHAEADRQTRLAAANQDVSAARENYNNADRDWQNTQTNYERDYNQQTIAAQRAAKASELAAQGRNLDAKAQPATTATTFNAYDDLNPSAGGWGLDKSGKRVENVPMPKGYDLTPRAKAAAQTAHSNQIIDSIERPEGKEGSQIQYSDKTGKPQTGTIMGYGNHYVQIKGADGSTFKMRSNAVKLSDNQRTTIISGSRLTPGDFRGAAAGDAGSGGGSPKGNRVTRGTPGQFSNVERDTAALYAKAEQDFKDNKIDELGLEQRKSDIGRLNSQRTRDLGGVPAEDSGDAPQQSASPQQLPKGNGQTIDANTARAYLQAAGGDKVKARQLASQNNWKF